MADTGTAPSTPAAQAAASRLAGMRPPAAVAAAAPEPEPSGRKAKKAKGKEADAGGKKKKPIKPILLVVVLLLVGYVVKGKVVKPHYGPKDPVPPGAIFDLPTSVTTNLPDGHLAQIAMSLQLTKVGSAKVVTKDTSEIMNTAVQIVGSQTYSGLLSVHGRVVVKQEILKAIQQELGTTDGAQQVSAVYFTSFVVQ
ncbi:MAG TPA: flagellar basal body-associated FliL family protein [Acidimicrobiales bacterium]|nr:flagellar basal body-associated FliL family protein [Acidimicrobiales bacterium]